MKIKYENQGFNVKFNLSKLYGCHNVYYMTHNFRMAHLGFHHVFHPVLITFREAYYLCWLSHIRIYSLLSFERKMTHPDLILWLELEKNDKKMGKNLDKKWTIFFSSRFIIFFSKFFFSK